MKKIMFLIVFLLILAGGGFLAVNYYSYLFARTVDGPIEAVERVTDATTIIGTSRPIAPNQLYSFAVAIRDQKSGEIITASSEDRQWAVAHKGQCAQARFFPYAPWTLDRAGTYFGARLLRLYDCPQK